MAKRNRTKRSARGAGGLIGERALGDHQDHNRKMSVFAPNGQGVDHTSEKSREGSSSKPPEACKLGRKVYYKAILILL